MKLHIFIKDELDHVLLDKEIDLVKEPIIKKAYRAYLKPRYSIPDNFSLIEQIDIASDIMLDREQDLQIYY